MTISPPCHTRNQETTDDWITPRWLVDRLGPFDLDPCACIPQPWPCADRQFTIENDGLMQRWDGFVWCNPPYGRKTELWLQHMAQHGNGIALVFARTETRCFFRAVWTSASALLFLRGRLTFNYPNGERPRMGHNSGGPSVLIGYGDVAESRLRENSDLGAFVKPEVVA